jgi:heme-degrading monooxygenase HmoA
MITRTWHGRTSLKNADYYLQFLLHEGTKEYLQTTGNLSVKVWERKEEDCCHFWTVTEWTDIEAVKGFAGEDYEKAVYYPEDNGILLEFEENVNHYETYFVSPLGEK